MPHFFHLSNNDKEVLPEEQKNFPEGTIHAVTYYLFRASEAVVAKVCHVSIFLVVPALAWGWSRAAVFYVIHFFVVGVGMATTFVLAHVSGVQAMPRAREATPRPHIP